MGFSEEWLSRAEAAERAKVSIKTIDRAVQDGHLQSVLIRRRRRIRADWFNTWLVRYGSGTGTALLVAVIILGSLCSASVLGLAQAHGLIVSLGGCRLVGGLSVSLDTPTLLGPLLGYFAILSVPFFPQTARFFFARA